MRVHLEDGIFLITDGEGERCLSLIMRRYSSKGRSKDIPVGHVTGADGTGWSVHITEPGDVESQRAASLFLVGVYDDLKAATKSLWEARETFVKMAFY